MRTTLAVIAICLLACREREPAPSALVSASAPVVPAASSSARAELVPRPTSEVARAGLRVRSGTVDGDSRWGFSELSLDPRKIGLEIVRAARGAPLPQLLPDGALAVVNGGYFEADFRPSTWLMHRGSELAPKVDTSKGGLLAVAQNGDVYLGPFAGLRFEPELALQSFPLIIELDGRPGIHRDDGKRAARSVACRLERDLSFVVIAAPRGDGPTLFETMQLLRKPWPQGFGCRTALNLDGGPSSGVWFSPELGAKQRVPTAPVAYGVALVPR